MNFVFTGNLNFDTYLSAPSSAINEVDPGFHEHVNSLRDTMFYVCQVIFEIFKISKEG